MQKDTLGPSALSILRIIAALGVNEAAIALLREVLGVSDLGITFDDPDIAFAISFESLERTWLEVNKDGSVTEYAADKILAGLDFTNLTSTQKQNLRAALEITSDTGGGTSATAAVPIALATAPQGENREHPTLVKYAANPIVELADQTASSILWPWIVDMRQDGGTGIALFWATDHATHEYSGAHLATAPGPEGPWTHHGMVFRDDVTGGEQHETPSVMWDEVNTRWLMYYQLKSVPGYNNQLSVARMFLFHPTKSQHLH